MILALWAAAALAGGWFGPHFLSHTKNSFDAPSGTRAAVAETMYDQLYAKEADMHTLLVLVRAQQAGVALVNESSALDFCRGINTALTGLLVNQTDSSPTRYRSVDGYFVALESVVPSLATSFVSADGSAMFWAVDFTSRDHSALDDALTSMRSLVDSLDTNPSRYSVGITGNDLMDYDIGEGTAHDMLHTDSLIMPIALAILCMYLKSLRLMLIPIVCVVLTMLGSFGVMLPVASYWWKVASFAPSIMMSLTIAMSIDWNLFLLTRYREEILSGRWTRECDAVAATVRASGEVVLASGLTLAITFASLIAFPVDFLSSIGIGSSVTLLVCLLVNLTFAPAMLFVFPRFFADFTMPRWLKCVLPSAYVQDVPERRFGADGLDDAFMPAAPFGNNNQLSPLDRELLADERASGSSRKSCGGRPTRSLNDAGAATVAHSVRYSGIGIASDQDEDGDTDLIVSPRSDSTPVPAHVQWSREVQSKSFWYRSGVFSTYSRPVSLLIVLVILGASVPFILACLKLRHTIDESQVLPRHAPSVIVFNEVQTYFPPGLVAPYHILVNLDAARINDTAAMPLLNPVYFNITSALVSSLLARGLADNTSLTSIVYSDGVWTRTPEEAAAMLAKGACPASQAACVYALRFRDAIADGTAPTCALVTITTPFPPLGDEAQPFVESVREVLDQYTAVSNAHYNGAFTFYLTGGATGAIDAVGRIYALFPYVILSTIVIVLVLVGIMFRSIIVPFRLVLTLAIPLAYTYGLTIMIFQEGDAKWLGSVVANSTAIYWLVPVMAFSVLVGLSLDYDIFLLARIFEYRRHGFTNRAAIRKGVYRTGSIITGAGIIMAIAFAGLLLSSQLVLNTFGFMLCFSVLLVSSRPPARVRVVRLDHCSLLCSLSRMFLLLQDTFVIRTILVPALLHLGGDRNWYPTKMPRPMKHDLDQEEDEEEGPDASGAQAEYFRTG